MHTQELSFLFHTLMGKHLRSSGWSGVFKYKKILLCQQHINTMRYWHKIAIRQLFTVTYCFAECFIVITDAPYFRLYAENSPSSLYFVNDETFNRVFWWYHKLVERAETNFHILLIFTLIILIRVMGEFSWCHRRMMDMVFAVQRSGQSLYPYTHSKVLRY